ncbi:hypothetical protein IT417_00810 [bacterium]|nr:hypothetical protein [bacterium]
MITNLHTKLKGKAGDFLITDEVLTKNIYMRRGQHIPDLLALNKRRLTENLPSKTFYRPSLYVTSGCSLAVMTYVVKAVTKKNYEVADIEKVAIKYGYGYDGLGDEESMATLNEFGIKSYNKNIKSSHQIEKLLKDNLVIASIWANYGKTIRDYYDDTNMWEGAHYVLFTQSFTHKGKKLFATIDNQWEKDANPWGYSAIGHKGYEQVRYCYLSDELLLDKYSVCPKNQVWNAGMVIVVPRKQRISLK